MFKRRSPLEKEWIKTEKLEQSYLDKNSAKNDSRLNQLLADKVPENLQSTLDSAFFKAFELIFEKGTGIIEKTYSKDRRQQEYMIKDYTAQIKNKRKNLKAFSKKSVGDSRVNLLLSGVSGVGLGVLGIGLPDIALFTSLLLKSLYQTALNYGYDYTDEYEKRFILMIIQGAVACGEQLTDINRQLNHFIETGDFSQQQNIKETTEQTAACLSKELLYMKFLQSVPVVGAVGGAYDAVYMKKINKYADLKYRRRFYYDRLKSRR